MIDEPGKTIARRSFYQVGDEAKTPIVQVEICTPSPSPHLAGEFMCSYRISSKGATKTETFYGVDELQALQLALADLKAKLERLNKASGYQFRWLEVESSDLGLRVPEF